jgi:parallel beta-helix repeat protein
LGYDKANGGILRADNAHFTNNLQAVHFYPYVGYENGYMRNNKSHFDNCKFLYDGTYSTNNSQVELQGIRGISFTNCEFVNKYWWNSINAIEANNSGLSIGSSSSPFVYFTSPNNGCKFSGFDKGIYITASSIHSTSVYSCDFKNNKIGIALEGAKDVTVKSCNYYDNDTGIYVKSSSLYKIENNIFSGGSNGVVVENTGNTNHFIRNNTFNNCTGILAIGNNGSNSNDCEQSEGVVFMCNYFNQSTQDIRVESNSRIRCIQSGRYITNATGNEFTNQFAGHVCNAGPYTFRYRWLQSNPAHRPYLFLCSNPYIELIPTEKDDCNGFYGCVGNAYYYYSEVEHELYDLHEEYYRVMPCTTKVAPVTPPVVPPVIPPVTPPDPTDIDWDDPVVMAIVAQLTMLDEFTVTINGNPPSSSLEKQVVEYYERTNLKQYTDALCYAALDILASDTAGLNMSEYRIWLERFNTVEAEYLLAESYMAIGAFSQAREIMNGILEKFPCVEIEYDQSYLDYLSFAEGIYSLGENEEIPSVLISELGRLSFSDDLIAVKAYSLGEMVVDNWRGFYTRDFEIHPACSCGYEFTRGGSSDSSSNSKEFNHNSDKSSKHRKSVEDDTLEENTGTDDIQIYPNPTTGQLTITTFDYPISDIRVFDIVGRQIYAVGQSEIGKSEIVIDISHLANGLYFLKVNGKTLKFVKE